MKWTEEETSLLNVLDGMVLEKYEIENKFPLRTLSSILKKSKNSGYNISIKWHHNKEWSDDENKIIFENYNKIDRDELLKLLPNRTWSNIRQQALKKFNLTTLRNKKWSKVEIEYLKNHYHNTSIETLTEKLHRSWDAIKIQSEKLKIKRDNMYRESILEILMTETNEKYYWLGFLLADGHFDPLKGRLTLTLSAKDEEHLRKFALYIKSDNIYKKVTEDHNLISVSPQNNEIIPKICSIYNIKSNKTFYPPELKEYDLSDDFFISLLAGFIDGDGSIGKVHRRKDSNLRIQLHKNWIENLEYIEDRLYKMFPYDKKKKLSKINNSGYASVCISNFRLLKELKTKVNSLNLPILNRKWDNIDLNLK